ncbi:MAG TPA: DNA repair protein RecO [Methylomirabilota bacterium]|nr:DNA repair protein RecO [Methylomirabilota bacterium]
MDERTTGCILRVRELTETSLIVHWLTRDLGRLATVAKGARRPRSAFHGKLDLFYQADLSLARSRRGDLHTLREVVLRETHPALRRDLGRLQQAAYAATLLEETTESGAPVPELFNLFTSFLSHVCTAEPSAVTTLAFEVKLLAALGLQPGSGETQGLSPGTRRSLEALGGPDWEMVSRLQLNESQIAEAARFLFRFLDHHVGRVPSVRAAALGGR